MTPVSDIDRALIVLVIANAAAFALFWFDKARAREHGPRVPERTLLAISLVGGLGAWMGQHILRHKTRKEPFRTWLGMVVVLHLLGAAAAFWLLLR
jgi:uncharacterized membrane protein YsdA (DUF1294 family)